MAEAEIPNTYVPVPLAPSLNPLYGGPGSETIREVVVALSDSKKDMHVGGAGVGFTTQDEFRLFNAIFSDLLDSPTRDELATNDLTIVERYADQLFNEGSLEVVKLSVFKTDKIQGGQKELDYLAIAGGKVAIFYDTGIAPGNSINYPTDNVKFVQTAGNVFDEGTGGKGLTEGEYLTFPPPGQTIQFSAAFMQSFGYRNLAVGVRFDGTYYDLVITHTPPDAGRRPWTIQERVHKNNKRVANDATNYFAGNRIKNAYIRSVLAMLRDGATIEEIQKWLISKGLGDLLQDLLMIAFAILNPSVLCLGYSNDRVYSGRILRFLRDNTGSVYNDPGKTDGFVTSNLRMQRKNEAQFTKWNRVFELRRQSVIAKNQHIINLLSLVIADANIVLRTIGAITRTPLILHLFRQISDTIRQANVFLSTVASFTPYAEGITEDQHNTNLILISEHEVIEFLEQIKTQKTTTVKILPIKSFFIGRQTESAVIDVLKVITTNTPHNLQTLITALTLRDLMIAGGYNVPAAPHTSRRTRIQRGGGQDELGNPVIDKHVNYDIDVYNAIFEVLEERSAEFIATIYTDTLSELGKHYEDEGNIIAEVTDPRFRGVSGAELYLRGIENQARYTNYEPPSTFKVPLEEYATLDEYIIQDPSPDEYLDDVIKCVMNQLEPYFNNPLIYTSNIHSTFYSFLFDRTGGPFTISYLTIGQIFILFKQYKALARGLASGEGAAAGSVCDLLRCDPVQKMAAVLTAAAAVGDPTSQAGLRDMVDEGGAQQPVLEETLRVIDVARSAAPVGGIAGSMAAAHVAGIDPAGKQRMVEYFLTDPATQKTAAGAVAAAKGPSVNAWGNPITGPDPWATFESGSSGAPRDDATQTFAGAGAGSSFPATPSYRSGAFHVTPQYSGFGASAGAGSASPAPRFGGPAFGASAGGPVAKMGRPPVGASVAEMLDDDHDLGGGARKTRSRKSRGSSRKSRNNHKNKTRKGNNRKYNRRTRRRS